MSEPLIPENQHNHDKDNRPLADDEEFEHVEEEIEVDDDGNEVKHDETQAGSEYPDWVSGKREHSQHRRHKRRIKVQKKVRVKKKSKKRKYKKVIERIIWTIIIIGFIASMAILIKELDIVDQNAKKKKKVMIQTKTNTEMALFQKVLKTQTLALFS